MTTIPIKLIISVSLENFVKWFLIYEVKLMLCDTIYIGNTQQKPKKIVDSHFSYVQCLLENGQS